MVALIDLRICIMPHTYIRNLHTQFTFRTYRIALFAVALLCSSCAQLPRKDVFFLPLQSDDVGYRIELNWNGEGSSSEARKSTGEYGERLERALKLSFENKEHRAALDEIFEDIDKAAESAECHLVGGVTIICRNAKGLTIKERKLPGQGGGTDEKYTSSKRFVSSSEHVMCIDGLAGPGACANASPESVLKRWRRRY
jgi:hypothetical protein